MTFVVGMWVASLAVVLSALLCPGRQVVTRSSPPLPPFWLVGSFPWPQVAPCSLWLGGSGGAWSRVLAKFYTSAKFSAASTLHFHFPHIILLPSSCTPARPRCAPWDLLPPLGRPSSESPLCVGISPQIPPLSSLLLPGELEAASHGGQRLRSVPPRMVISFIVMQRLISLSCVRTEQIDCKYYFVMVILHEHWSRPKKTLAF